MQLRDLTQRTIQDAIREFYTVTSDHVGRIGTIVGNERIAIPKTPRKLGTYQFDYFYAADIDQLARYALGGLEMARPYVLELCDATETALFTCAAGVRVTPPADWYDTPIGFIVRACRARAAVRKEDGPPLAAADVRAIADEPDKLLEKAGLLREGGDPPAAVRAFLEENGKAV